MFFGVLPLLIGWKFNIAGVSLTGPRGLRRRCGHRGGRGADDPVFDPARRARLIKTRRR
jgi:hypothetical protein